MRKVIFEKIDINLFKRRVYKQLIKSGIKCKFNLIEADDTDYADILNVEDILNIEDRLVFLFQIREQHSYQRSNSTYTSYLIQFKKEAFLYSSKKIVSDIAISLWQNKKIAIKKFYTIKVFTIL